VGIPKVGERYDLKIAQNSQLVIDEGRDQEIVTVKAVDLANKTFTANFTKQHKPGFVVSNTLLGNPGPQAQLVPGNRMYAQDALANPALGYTFVVRYVRVHPRGFLSASQAGRKPRVFFLLNRHRGTLIAIAKIQDCPTFAPARGRKYNADGPAKEI
jgi:hypothetical protein